MSRFVWPSKLYVFTLTNKNERSLYIIFVFGNTDVGLMLIWKFISFINMKFIYKFFLYLDVPKIKNRYLILFVEIGC